MASDNKERSRKLRSRTRDKSRSRTAAQRQELALESMRTRHSVLMALATPGGWAIPIAVGGYFLYRIIEALAGKETIADIDIAVGVTISIALGVAWKAHVSILQRKNKGQAKRLEDQRVRIAELEATVQHLRGADEAS